MAPLSGIEISSSFFSVESSCELVTYSCLLYNSFFSCFFLFLFKHLNFHLFRSLNGPTHVCISVASSIVIDRVAPKRHFFVKLSPRLPTVLYGSGKSRRGLTKVTKTLPDRKNSYAKLKLRLRDSTM